MSEAKHTHGPWQYLPESPENCAAIVAKTAFVCEFFCGPAEANARLIAAAPDLLEALVAIDNALRAAWSNGSLPDSVIPAELAQQCRAAIAKATKAQT